VTTRLEAADDFGAALRRQRETVHRSLRDLADATKLGVRTLDALERNHVEKLPPGIFRRAVVRAYAREVGLDPEHTLRLFLASHPDDLPSPGAAAQTIVDVPAGRARLPRALLAGVLLAVLVALVLAARAFGLGAPAPAVIAPPAAPAAASA
jgi:cytoskeletal protein RodZ